MSRFAGIPTQHAGKKAQVGESADMPHSFAYIEDVGRAAVMLGTREEAFGRVWIAQHAAARTQREMIEITCQQLGVSPQIAVIAPFMMRIAGLFIPEARASVEMMCEFTEPFILIPRGKPPALPGDSRSLTVPGLGTT